jgi:hypothetical protein
MLHLIDGVGGVVLFVILALCWHFAVYRRNEEWRLIGYFFFFAFAGRGLIAILNTIFQILAIQQDAARYHYGAIQVADMLTGGGYGEILQRGLTNLIEPGYTLVLGSLYFIFGKSVLVGFVTNTFFFSLTAFNVYRIGAILFGSKGGQVAAFFYLMLPYSVLHSTYLYRDPVINYFISEFFYRLLILSRGERQTPAQWLWIGFVFIYSGILRRENLVMLTAIVGFLMFRRVLVSRTLLKPIIIVSTAFILSAGAIIIFQNADIWILRNFKSLVEVEMLNQRMESLDEAQSSYLQDETYSSYFDIIKYAPIRAVYFMFSPFPWDIFKKSQYIPFLEGVVIGCFLVFLPGALLKVRKENINYFYAVTLYLVCGIVGSGLIQSNSAGAQRHRTQFTFLIVAIAVPYLYNCLLRRISLCGTRKQKIPSTPCVAYE